jgi:hypothetical protein
MKVNLLFSAIAPRCGLHRAWQDFSQGENQITSLTSLAIAAWRLTVNAPSSAGAKVTLVGLQAGIG